MKKIPTNNNNVILIPIQQNIFNDWANSNYISKDLLVANHQIATHLLQKFLISNEQLTFKEFVKTLTTNPPNTNDMFYFSKNLLNEYAFLLGFETVQDNLKESDLKTNINDNSKEISQKIKTWNKTKAKIQQQTNLKINDFQTLKLLRDCFAHNDEQSENFQKRYSKLNTDNESKITLSTTQKGKNLEFLINSNELDNILDLIELTFRKNPGQMIFYVDENKKRYYGYIYNNQRIESIDKFQKQFLEKTYNKLKNDEEFFIKIPKLFPLKNNSAHIFDQVLALKKALEKLDDNTTKSDFEKNFYSRNSELFCYDALTYPVLLMIVSGFNKINANATPTALSHNLLKNVNLTKKYHIDEKQALFVVSKLRNSLLHGQFFYDPQPKPLLFLYDKLSQQNPQKSEKQTFENLDKNIQQMYQKKGMANNKIVNLECITKISPDDLIFLLLGCWNIGDLSNSLKERIANATNNFFKFQKQTNITEIVDNNKKERNYVIKNGKVLKKQKQTPKSTQKTDDKKINWREINKTNKKQQTFGEND